ncbi:MAG: glutamine-hydrolyzing carbamoyl-phosphate synthase small subunit, partial [Bacteroidia bacterium]|nr:glutamine-hydrolyzing carbamoyl-phosphate synthase small subunit [Bacteroidia bacterium]
MSVINSQKAYLVLADGTVFEGKAIGKIGTTSGEIAFNTGMTGYQEVFTDPSYFGQIVVMTMDHIGNYGAAEMDAESGSIKISGLVCKNYSPMHSRAMADSSLNDYFIEHGFSGISDVDTREIVKHIRDAGAMNAVISSEILDLDELKRMVKEVPSMEGLELSSKVWSKKEYEVNESGTKKVALLDLGSKNNIIDCLTERGCHVKVFPGDTSYAEMKSWNPSGFMISNGPGDPAAMPLAVKTVKDILDANDKLFGICLGSQILAQAVGMKTFKLKKGHRGQNHPVQNLLTGKSEMTSQNHGFAVDPESNTGNAEVTHINLNDNTVEGIRVKDKNAFAVQYHPE